MLSREEILEKWPEESRSICMGMGSDMNPIYEHEETNLSKQNTILRDLLLEIRDRLDQWEAEKPEYYGKGITQIVDELKMR